MIAINTVHNLERAACIAALREIERVAKGHAFITVDAWRDEAERERMFARDFSREHFAAFVARLDGKRQRPTGMSDLRAVGFVHSEVRSKE